MRTLIVAAALALAAASGAQAQTRGYAPTTSISGDPARIQRTTGPQTPGPAVRPGAETARLGPYRGRRMMRHRVSPRVCLARGRARGLHGRALTRFIHRCEIGRG